MPLEVGRDVIESMYGYLSGDAIPLYIATSGGKIPLHRSNVVSSDGEEILLKKPWKGEGVSSSDADLELYNREKFAFNK